jgi:OPA family glycerol-3-phosphate transporter-like MFS transporter/OPA family sugar phosphate sensor protein UhpC-like MFS transporter
MSLTQTPPAPPSIADPTVASRFRYWQYRTLIATMFGYAAFYLVRKNLSFAMPGMQDDLGITKASLGLFLTLHGLLCGVSRLVNGMWAEALIGITAAIQATRRAAATAAGFTGLFGYGSTIVSGWGLGLLVQRSGWNTAFGALLAIGAMGAFMFILAWPAKAHGYASASHH